MLQHLDLHVGYVLQTTEEVKESKTEEKVEPKKGCTDDEVVAVLSHELGHWSLNHVFKNFFIGQVCLYTGKFSVCR